MEERMDVEEGEAIEDFDGTDRTDIIAQKIAELLGDAQKEFEGGVYTDKLGSKFGGYGSFLPTELRAPSVLAQAKPAAAAPTTSNSKDKISPGRVGEIRRMEATALVTDASRGGTCSVDKASAGLRLSLPDHAVKSQNLFVGFNGRNEDIQASYPHSQVKETDLNWNAESANTVHCPSALDRGAVSVYLPNENARSKGAASGSIAATGDTSSKTQNSGGDKDFEKMERKKATLITLRIKKDPEGDIRRKNRPIYSGLGLNDSSSLSLEEEQEDETYLSDAYSSPDLSPLTMIQVVVSRLQPKFNLLLSPLPELIGPPTDPKIALLRSVKGSSTALSSAVKGRVVPEDCLEKTDTLTESKVSEGRDKKESLQARPKVRMAEVKSTFVEVVPKAQMEIGKYKKFIQDLNADAHRILHEAAKEYEGMDQVGREAVMDTRDVTWDSSLSRDATEIPVGTLDPSKQESAKKSDAVKKPMKTSKKEKGKVKPKDRAVVCESLEERNERRAPDISISYAKNMRDTNLLVTEKEGQGTVQRKEFYETSKEANIFRKEFPKLHIHDLGAGKADIIVGEEYGKDSTMKSSKVAKEDKDSFQRKDHSPISGMGGSLKDVVRDVKKDTVRKSASTKHHAEKVYRDVSQMKESSKDRFTAIDKEREGKKDPSKKGLKQSAFALEKNAKDFINVAARELELEHVATSSEYHETGMKNFGKDSKYDKLIRKELKTTQEGGMMLKESVTKITEACVAEKNNVEGSFSNMDRYNLGISTTEPVPATSAPPGLLPAGTLVVENWVLCDKCGRWRLLLPEIDPKKLPKKFFCKMLDWLPGMNNCRFEEDETSNAVYAYLGIPNPKFTQLNALATQPQLSSLPPASSLPAPFSSLNSSIVTEKTQETKRTIVSKAASNKKSLAGKLPLGLSKSSSFSKKGESGSTKSKKLNDVEHVSQDRDQAYPDLKVHGDDENSLSLLKTKRKQVKTSSAEELEGVPALKKTKMEEASNCYSLGTHSRSRENMAHHHDYEVEGHFHDKLGLPSKSSSKITTYCQEFKKTESSAALPNTRKHQKEGTPDGGVEHKRSCQSKTLEEQPIDNSLSNAGRTNGEKYTSKVGDTKVDRKFKVRLKRDEDIQKGGKRRLEDEVSNSPFHNEKRMKHTNADGTNSRQNKGELRERQELGTRAPAPLGKERLPVNALQEQEQPKGMKNTEKSLAVGAFKEASEIGRTYLRDNGPESFLRGTPSKVANISDEAAARKRRRQRSLSPLPSSSSQVSSPESSTRKSKGPLSPVESTVSSPPVKVSKADESAIGKRSLRKDENHVTSNSSGPTYFVTHSCSPSLRKPINHETDNHCDTSGPGKQKLRSQDGDFRFSDEVSDYRPDSGRELNNVRSSGANPALVDGRGSWNSDHNNFLQDEWNDHRGPRGLLETKSHDTNNKCNNGQGLERDGAEKSRERDGRNGRYDRHDKDFNKDRDFHDGIRDKRMSETGCDGWEDKFAKQKKVRDTRGRVSLGGSHPDTQFEVNRLAGMKTGILPGHLDRFACSDGRDRHKDATCDIKQETRVKDMEGVGKESYLRPEQEDALHTTHEKDLPERYEKIEGLHWKEGKMGSASQVATSPKVVSVEKLVGARTGSKEGEAVVVRNAEDSNLLSNSDSRIRVEQEKHAGITVSGAKLKNLNDVSLAQSGENLTQGREPSKGVDEIAGSRGTGPRRMSPVNGHMLREADVGGASNMKGQPAHQASALIKEAKSLKHTADRLQGSEAIRGDLYLHAALKFLQGAAILESSQDGGAKHLEIQALYSDTAKLCEYCATVYAKDTQATALALKCAAVARMRVLRVKNPSTTRTLAEIQATMQLANPSPLGESPSSSSASDVDNLNNQAVPHDKLQATNTAKEVSSPSLQASAMSGIPASARHHPNITRVLRDAAEMCAAVEAWMKADLAIAAAKVTYSDASFGDIIKRVGEIGFSDVAVLVRLVNSALEALRR
ncbi:hypothetical protein O6H91_07G006900 [Diphasiastrum complanatum]|uniref:Uncharacterized protein n=5 Tax=Diphasiastrum complanatum TaxID=34168 RepID=A0ACC2D247_DIPCM|nr:hypothetical protein O6H91_07G006900 [Diphasiastrum complanatum]KAJ7548314.1 hypothetical protein O6H91_07G006900 [Diphasiastrum complanatum]KAJ7548315.1 hypothetical protein O6H91_07G006900 [Diphasiastrum complanatum]KAJ7548316.1 hypothetical protein O6H91_07G006900 [Diphasiastrum complanatum]KAJ7548317.1 hypothetical protein O6H91_07G006900 [Diphasiastrum complanatum]